MQPRHSLAIPVPRTGSGIQRRHRLRLVLFGVSIVAVLGLVIAGATAAIVLSGSTKIGLIRNRVQAALEERLGPEFDVSVGSAIVEIDPTLGLVVDLGEIEVANGDSGVLISLSA